MKSLYDLKKYAETGIAAPGMTAFDKMRARAALGGFPIASLTGEDEIQFDSDGKPLISWYVKGNEVQDGTPAPDNIIIPSETGDPTANLWNEDYAIISTALKYVSIYVGNGEFTLSTTCPRGSEGRYPCLFFLTGQATSGASSSTNGVELGVARTVTATDGYVTIAYRGYSDVSPVDYKTMLNSGSTALDYEPYGYKLEISCGGQTYNVYLKEPIRKINDYADVLTASGTTGTVTRNAFKWVITGNENINLASSDANRTVCTILDNNNNIADVIGICSHLVWKKGSSYLTNEYNRIVRYGTKGIYLSLSNEYLFAAGDLTAFKSYLQQQYAAGTPVTVWYVLAEPETETFDAPQIQTAKGENTFTVETTLPPSEVGITGHIKAV